MTRKLFLLLTLTALFAGALMAADVTGKWVAQVPGRDGNTREVTYTFKADGATLTGSQSGMQGAEMPISEGKIDGDNISFKVVMERNGNKMEWAYTGTVSGDEMKLKRAGGRGEPIEFAAKRAK